jgi:hypothetical protein
MAGAERRVRVLALVAEFGPRVERLCEACLRQLTDISGAGLVVMTALPARGSRYHSDKTSTQVDDLQFALGEGPGLEAFASGQPVLVRDLAERGHESRWPTFAPAATAAGARGMFAFPLRIGAIRIGFLDLYRDRPGVLDDGQLAEALAFADAATLLLLAEDHSDTTGWQAQADRDDRAVVHQATGMIMEQASVDAIEAFAMLRAHAYATAHPLGNVADDVVGRRVRFDNPDSGD